MTYLHRNEDLALNDEGFLKKCSLSFFKATGRGGQKKNKTSSAVRLVHIPTKLSATSSDSRQQSSNKLYALRRLKLALAIQVRLPPKKWSQQEKINEKNPAFALFIASLLDIFDSCNWSLAQSAKFCNLSTNQLAKICLHHTVLLTCINQQRKKRNLPAIR